MKNRLGFVSNSSSASFILYKDLVPQDKLEAIRNHYQYALDHGYASDLKEEDAWNICETEHIMFGDTIMDNFNMKKFFKKIKFSDYVGDMTSELRLNQNLRELERIARIIDNMKEITESFVLKKEVIQKMEQLQINLKKFFEEFPILFEDEFF